MDQELEQLARKLGEQLAAKGLVMTTAESCTGGWVAKALTDIAGSSGCFDRGFITYSNEAKQEMLGVSEDTLERHGAVSEETVREMTQGALDNSQANVAVSISGIAGPGGGTSEKPVGTVCLAWGRDNGELVIGTYSFKGDRDQVRRQAVITALNGVLKIID
ncbi:nicotinamide-nucleotide amidase [Solemya velesiana gill symbiont]|uniref:Damage-inducible protein CinA n=1 Tax=Solemya velesiana gill symbiont TaxID=1918948 RepID=A0A1T2KSN4_9GAMM|nr:nicotinamide-nucleotide amidase [Solemya velesiana gill symbiont]OOZ35878.1 damage-inducible protein CinA [Solemya velesiana gill symbiont]